MFPGTEPVLDIDPSLGFFPDPRHTKPHVTRGCEPLGGIAAARHNRIRAGNGGGADAE
jgi:hypothetical protein